jgi:hypothetical protein
VGRDFSGIAGPFKQLIEIDTTDSVGSTTISAEAMAKGLRSAGFPVEDVVVIAPHLAANALACGSRYVGRSV